MVSVLALYSDGPSSNPAEAYIISVKLLKKRAKINKKYQGWPIITYLSSKCFLFPLLLLCDAHNNFLVDPKFH